MITILETVSFSYPSIDKPVNEDSYLLPTIYDDQRMVIAIADGVSNSQSGNLASDKAIQAISKLLRTENFSITNAFELALSKIRNLKENSVTTLTIVEVTSTTLTVGHIGDCRAYYKYKNKLIQITKDHTKYQEMLESNEFKIRNLKNHRERLSSVLTKALTKDHNFEPSMYQLDIQEIMHDSVSEIDIYLMSDGAYKIWDKRPSFSQSTMSSPSSFALSLKRRIQKNILDDYSLIGVKIKL